MVKRVFGLTVVVILVGLVGVYVLSARQTAPKSAAGGQSAPAAAADISKMPLLNVTVVQIKPELVTEWMDFQKNETIPMLQKAGVKERNAGSTVVGPAFEYVFLTPAKAFADRDGDSPPVRALGQEGARAYAQKNRRFIASQRTFVVRMRTDLSYMPDMNAALPVAVVSEYSIAAGRVADFENYIKTDLTAAHKQLKTGGFTVYQPLFGGNGSGAVVVAFMHNYAELDQGPAITRAFGAARAAAVQQKLAGVVTHVERTLSHYVPELSFKTKAVTENR
jgi:hypothetical protein